MGDNILDSPASKAYDELQHWAKSWLCAEPGRGYFLVLNEYTGYFDESGIDTTSAVFTVAGYLATVEEWQEFTPEWDHVLADFRITKFRMVEFAQSTGEFRTWKDEEDKRQQFVSRLIDIIDRRITYVFSMSLMREDYDTVNKEYQLEERLASPYALCGLGVIHLAYQWRESHPDAQMKFIFHDKPLGKGKFQTFIEEHGATVDAADIAFMKDHRAIEAADFAAYEHRLFFTNVKNRILADDISHLVPRKTFELLQTKTIMRQSFKLLTDEGIRHWCERDKIPRR